VFANLSWWEIIVLALLGLFIFGPERLPKVISDGVRILRQIRSMARNATSDLSRELGTEVQLEDLNPKTFIRKHILSEEDEAELRKPFDSMFKDVKQVSSDLHSDIKEATSVPPAQPNPNANGHSYDQVRPYDGTSRPYQPESSSSYEPNRYDSDAT
jgi:sec-independent protein translocase protein TatB